MNMAVRPVTDEQAVQELVGTHCRRSFTEIQSTKLIQLCRNIMTRKGVNQTDVIGELQSTSEGLTLLLQLKEQLGEGFNKTITDRVRCELRKH